MSGVVEPEALQQRASQVVLLGRGQVRPVGLGDLGGAGLEGLGGLVQRRVLCLGLGRGQTNRSGLRRRCTLGNAHFA